MEPKVPTVHPHVQLSMLSLKRGITCLLNSFCPETIVSSQQRSAISIQLSECDIKIIQLADG
jgi:hypothetical protein